MKTTHSVCAVIGTCSLAALSLTAHAVVVGVPDTFETGTVQEWFGGPTITNASGGPAGASDHFLRVQTSSASGSGSHIGAHNSETRWTGDFGTAGVTAVQADMINLGSSTVTMRLVIFGLGTRWTSTTGVTLAPGSGWQRVNFPVSQSGLTRVLGSATYTDSLSVVSQTMFRHDAGTPSSGGETLAGTIGVDNIMAVPAPGAAGVLGLGALLAARRRR